MKVITFGRHPNNDVVRQNCIVERNHAIITQCDDGTFFIEDCQTMNGIYVNGHKIGGRHTGGWTILHRWDEIRLASYVLDWEKYFALGSRLKAVIEAIDSFDFEKGTRLDFILPLLSTAHLPKCYVLSSFRYGVENFGHKYIPYVHKRRAIIEWCPPIDLNYESPIRGKRKRNLFQVSGPYKDHYYISGIWGYERIIDSVPSILPYFELAFSQEGILDAWILRNLGDLLPKYWHACYEEKNFICGQETIDELFPNEPKGNSYIEQERNNVKNAIRALDIDE